MDMFLNLIFGYDEGLCVAIYYRIGKPRNEKQCYLHLKVAQNTLRKCKEYHQISIIRAQRALSYHLERVPVPETFK